MSFELVGTGVGTDSLQGIASQYGGQYQVGDKGRLVLHVPDSPFDILENLVQSLAQDSAKPDFVTSVSRSGNDIMVDFTVASTPNGPSGFDSSSSGGAGAGGGGGGGGAWATQLVVLPVVGIGLAALGRLLMWAMPFILAGALAMWLGSMMWQLLKDVVAKVGQAAANAGEWVQQNALLVGGIAVAGVLLLLLLSGGEEGGATGGGTVIVVR